MQPPHPYPQPSRRGLTESVQIALADGSSMGGYLARPADGEAHGSVIVGMELFGVTSHVRDVCDRLAALGYLAIAPDLYHRTAPGIELAADDAGRARGFELFQQLTRDQVIGDISAVMSHLRDRATPLAAMVGLSVGGHIAFLAATRLDLPAVAIFYGGWLPTTDVSISAPEPTLAGSASITARVLMLVGDDDPIIPAEHRQQIADALDQGDVEHEIIGYPGVGHGFLCDRRSSFHPEAANDAWQRLAEFLAQTAHSASGFQP